MEGLPEDLEIQILCRLPIKYVLLLKSVCKSWNTLLKSPTFARLHLFKCNHHVDYCLVSHKDLYSEFPEEEIISLLSGETFGNIQLLEHTKSVSVIGICDGIILSKFHNGQFGLFNPATKDFKVIPAPPETNMRSRLDPSFGFDVEGNDYKILRFLSYNHNFWTKMSGYKVQIYSLYNGGGLWKEIDHPALPGFEQPNLQRIQQSWKDVCHFVTIGDEKEFSIISFDIRTETFGYIGAPFTAGYDWDEDRYMFLTLDVIKGDIALLTDYVNIITTWIDVWVMKEYGNEESWVKIYSTGIITAKPLGFWKNETILLQLTEYDSDDPPYRTTGELVSCNLITQDLKRHNIHGRYKEMMFHKFIPSLLPLEISE